MKEERVEQINQLLREHREYLKNNGEGALLSVAYHDRASGEINGMDMRDLKRDSDTVKRLESLGYKVIYPAELSEERISSMSTSEKYVYDRKMNHALIIDKQEECQSLEFGKMITDHYLSAEPIRNLWSVESDKNNNSINNFIDTRSYKEGTDKDLQGLLKEVGVDSTIEQGNYYKKIGISSEVPYPTVKKSKFAQIYDNAKGKIQGVFAKLKSLVNSKEQVKDNDQNER